LTNPAPGGGSGFLWRLSHEKPLVQDHLLEVALSPHASPALVSGIDLDPQSFPRRLAIELELRRCEDSWKLP
jgi:hypothetical protein